MAKKEAAAAAPAEAGPESGSEAAPKKKPPIKAIAIVLVLLVVEGALVMMLAGGSGKPKETKAAEHVDPHAGEAEKLVESLVLKDRFPNTHTGRTWIWDTEIQVQVKQKHEERVTGLLTARAAEIKTGIARIWRTAQHNHFNEPGLETLTRQVTEFLDTVIGTGADGKSYLERVLISRCVGFPTEF